MPAATTSTDTTSRHVPRAAAFLGAAGVLPFVAATAVAIWGGSWAGFAHLALLAYGAVILSFLGGIHWGLALRQLEPDPRLLVQGVLPSLVGWAAILLGGMAGLLLLALAFAAVLALDHHLARDGTAPPWYLRLRLPLTAAVVACLVLAAVAAG